MIDAIDAALQKRELIKLAVLDTSGLTARDAAEALSAATGAEVIQCIGRRFVLYRSANSGSGGAPACRGPFAPARGGC